MAADWTQRPTVQQCGCGAWTMTAPMLSGRTVTLSLDVFTPVSFALWASSGRKPVYVVVNGGACLVRAGDGTRMGDWRREHACDAQSGPQSAAEPFVAPCETDPDAWCERSAQQRSAGVVNCDACDRPPFEHSPEQIIICQLGGQVIERMINDRVVYRLASAFQ